MSKNSLLAFLLFFPFLAFAKPTIGIFPGKTILSNTETQKLWVSGTNEGPEKTVDVHIGLISPSGVVYEYPNWNTSLDPWLKSLKLPKDFHFPAQLVTELSKLPTKESGIWQAAAAITEPGTLNVISIATQEFSNILKNGDANSSADPRVGIVVLQSLTQSSTGFEFLTPFGVFWFSEDEPNFGNTLSINFPNSAFNNAPIEGCIFEQPLLDNLNTNDFQVATLDAGKLDLTSSSTGLYHIPNTTSFFNRIFKDDFINQESLKIEPGVKYTLSGEGGADIGAFSLSLTAPESVSFTTPSGKGIVTQTASKDMTIKWPKGKGQEVVLVSIKHSNTQGNQRAAISCQFVDDGNATIPSAQLEKMKEYIGNSAVTSFLTISRNSSGLIKPKGNNLDYGVFSVGNATVRELRLR